MDFKVASDVPLLQTMFAGLPVGYIILVCVGGALYLGYKVYHVWNIYTCIHLTLHSFRQPQIFHISKAFLRYPELPLYLGIF